MAQVVLHPTSKQEGSGFDSWARYQWKFSKYFNRGSGGSETHLKLLGPIIKEVGDLQGRDSMSQGKLLGGFWVILRDLFVLILEDSQTP